MNSTRKNITRFIVFQDDDLVIINKPSMLLSVPGRGPDKYDSVATRLQNLLGEIHVVHRLDWETSGVMVFAKNKFTLRALNQQFMQRKVTKHYYALVHGKMFGRGMIDFPLIADWERRPRQKVDYQKGKASKTFWKLVSFHTIHKQLCSYIKLSPLTGRSHQLRVHLASLSHPILGDHLYAQPRAVNMAERLQLHASYLNFTHPRTQKNKVFEVPDCFIEKLNSCLSSDSNKDQNKF